MAIHRLDWHQTPPQSCRQAVLSVGNFDGVHRGHARLIEVARALCPGVPAVALTFDPHPAQILHPDRCPPVLTTTADRGQLLSALGADEVVFLNTTRDLLHLTAEEFFQQVLCQRFAARALVEGTNFGFGRNRTGNVQTLRELCQQAGLRLEVVPPVEHAGEPISSSRVRASLLAGDVALTGQLLGRPYRLRGQVSTGSQRGQRLGFPTANLDPTFTLVPGEGVYAVRVPLGERSWPGAANIGPNPTFGEQTRKVEVHLIDFAGELYGQEIAVDFLARLRDVRRFAGVEELLRQLRADIEQARAVAGPPS